MSLFPILIIIMIIEHLKIITTNKTEFFFTFKKKKNIIYFYTFTCTYFNAFWKIEKYQIKIFTIRLVQSFFLHPCPCYFYWTLSFCLNHLCDIITFSILFLFNLKYVYKISKLHCRFTFCSVQFFSCLCRIHY